MSPKNAEMEAKRVCRQPGPDAAALLAWLGGMLVGVASYEPTAKPGVAEVAGLIHKTEAGAVKLDLHGQREVRRAFRDLAATFGAGLAGVLVQPMLTGGVEVLVGVVEEPVFGQLVVFGLGGVATEVLGDHVARLTPLTDTDADEMIRSLRAAPLLLGHRGTPPVDIGALTGLLLRVSRLVDDLPEVAELDLNPVVATADGACAVDARVRVSPARPRDPFLRQLR